MCVNPMDVPLLATVTEIVKMSSKCDTLLNLEMLTVSIWLIFTHSCRRTECVGQ